MSWKFFTRTEPIAKKEYDCDAWLWLRNCDYTEFDQLTFSDRKAIVRAKRNGFKIQPGDKYIKVEGLWEGDFVTFRAIPELDAICHEYDVYED